jgi:predicted component of type VI protein secretion system
VRPHVARPVPAGPPVTLGRSRDNTVVLRDEMASRTHAKIYFEDGCWHVRDFGLNGTRVDGVRVNGAVELTDGQRVKIGEVVLRFALEPKVSPRVTPPAPRPRRPCTPARRATAPGWATRSAPPRSTSCRPTGPRPTRRPTSSGGWTS